MGIEILAGDMGGLERAAVCCRVTERPVEGLPLFEGAEDAERFLAFAKDAGVPDVRRCGPAAADKLHSRWMAQAVCDDCSARLDYVVRGPTDVVCTECRIVEDK